MNELLAVREAPASYVLDSLRIRPGCKQTDPLTGSGQGLGVIPEDWEASTIGKNSKWMSGGTPRRNNAKFWSGTIPWISGSTLKSAEISTSDQFLTTEAVSAGSKMAPVDSTLLLVRGSALHNEIRAGLVVLPVAFNQDVKALVPNITVEPKFLTYYILAQSGELLKLVSSAGNSAGVLDTELVQNFKFLKPPLPEQRAIAAVLSDVDALLASLDKLIAKKRDLKQGVMQQLLTGQRRLPGFSGEWEAKRLGDLFTFSGGLSASRDQLSNSGYCYLHYGDIHKSSKIFIDVAAEFMDIPKLDVHLNDVIPSALLKDGDVVFVDASEDDEGTSRHWVVVNREDLPFISGLHTIVAKSRDNSLSNGFKRYCFQTQNIKQQFQFFAVGTKVSGISKTNIAKLELKFPPLLEEQTAIAAVLSDMDAEITALEARRDKTRALKQGMMQELLTGRIRLV
ncbi:MAG: restriction endonuclease subunit S [Nitrosomonadales bacterium]|nr:restriction endonuclease subunit S [Nitrosomonadales bacterium]